MDAKHRQANGQRVKAARSCRARSDAADSWQKGPGPMPAPQETPWTTHGDGELPPRIVPDGCCGNAPRCWLPRFRRGADVPRHRPPHRLQHHHPAGHDCWEKGTPFARRVIPPHVHLQRDLRADLLHGDPVMPQSGTRPGLTPACAGSRVLGSLWERRVTTHRLWTRARRATQSALSPLLPELRPVSTVLSVRFRCGAEGCVMGVH